MLLGKDDMVLHIDIGIDDGKQVILQFFPLFDALAKHVDKLRVIGVLLTFIIAQVAVDVADVVHAEIDHDPAFPKQWITLFFQQAHHAVRRHLLTVANQSQHLAETVMIGNRIASDVGRHPLKRLCQALIAQLLPQQKIIGAVEKRLSYICEITAVADDDDLTGRVERLDDLNQR